MDVIKRKEPVLRNTLMLIISLILGAAGVYFSKQFIEGKVDFYRSQMQVNDELVEAVVPNVSLKKGQVVTSNLLSVREFPRKYIDANYVQNNAYSRALGQKLAFDVKQGMPLLWAHLEGGVSPTFSGKIEDGLRALTVPVNEVNSISGFLQPNDNVDLLLTYSGDRVSGKMTMPLIQNLKVMATGVKTVVNKAGGSNPARFSTITVHVTSEEAKKIILAQDIGKITATLRHPDDEVIDTRDIMTVRDVLGLPELPKPIKRKPRAPVKQKKGIEFIIGGI